MQDVVGLADYSHPVRADGNRGSFCPEFAGERCTSRPLGYEAVTTLIEKGYLAVYEDGTLTEPGPSIGSPLQQRWRNSSKTWNKRQR